MVTGANAMSKTTGLAAFTKKTTETSVTSNVRSIETRRRGKGEVVSLTVRLPRAEWERVHQLAVAEGASIQALAVAGLSKIFAEKGLPEITS